jgi:predicted metal-binding transcription factor (methanogenesis marker protein 9)
LYTFKAVAEDLEIASSALREVSIEATENARVQQERANEALAEANANLNRAAKVRDLVG